MSFPEHPIWDFSLRIYRKPGVADACLFLQDRYGLNVNVILMCVWSAAAGQQPLAARHFELALRRIRDWERIVIRPLRDIRRACRQEPLGVPDYLLQSFRPLAQALELDAEHVEQLIIAEVVQDLGADDGCEPAAAARQSLTAYMEVTDVPRDKSLVDCLNIVLAAAFDGASYSGD